MSTFYKNLPHISIDDKNNKTKETLGLESKSSNTYHKGWLKFYFVHNKALFWKDLEGLKEYRIGTNNILDLTFLTNLMPINMWQKVRECKHNISCDANDCDGITLDTSPIMHGKILVTNC